VVIRDLYVVGLAIPPHEAQAEPLVDSDTVLAFTVMAQLFQPIAGRIRKSSTLVAEGSIASFFLEALRRFAGGILGLFPVSQKSFVLWSAKVLITVRV
jgi:hypothetical protein